MSGPAEDGCRVCLQQHGPEYPGSSQCREFAAASSQHGSAVTYQLLVFCSLAAVSLRK